MCKQVRNHICFLIRFAQIKIALFIFFNNWVSKGKPKFSASRAVFFSFLREYDVAKLFEADNSDSGLSSVYP